MPPIGELFSFLAGVFCGVLGCAVIILCVVNEEMRKMEKEGKNPWELQ
jgi:hypothetical protein